MMAAATAALFGFVTLALSGLAAGVLAHRIALNVSRRAHGLRPASLGLSDITLILSAAFACMMIAQVALAVAQ